MIADVTFTIGEYATVCVLQFGLGALVGFSVAMAWVEHCHNRHRRTLERLTKALPLLLLLLIPSLSRAAPKVGGPTSPLDGKTEVQVDLPVELRQHNVGGRDGAGLCVFTSIEHAARWQHEVRLDHFQEQMRSEPGGGYPAKVDAMIKKYAPGVAYLQYEGKDDALLKAALKSGRLPGVTYNGHDPHYGGSIAHMVNLAYLDDSQACVLDNNFVGEGELVWMSRDEFRERWTGRGEGWAVVLLAPPPPPPPKPAAGDVEGLYPIAPHFPIPWRPRPWIPPHPPKPPAPKPVGESLAWVERHGDLYLYRDGLQIGGYDVQGGFWRDYDPWTQHWGEPRLCPHALPEGFTLNFGVGPLGKSGERYDLSGVVVSKEQALHALDVPSDATLLRLTVIGPPAESRPVLDDLERSSILAPWKGRLVVQSYDPSRPLDAPLLRCGLPADGHPTVLLQRPDGTVLHHQKDYADGAAGLALALRKCDPSYKPEKDPDQRQASAVDVAVPQDDLAAALAALVAVVGALVKKGLSR